MPQFRRVIRSGISKLARSPSGGRLLAWTVTHFDTILPINRLYDSENVLAFYHPQPAYPFHILIVPKQPVSDLMSLQEAHAPLLAECITAAQILVEKFDLTTCGYRLVLNGGRYQEIPQLHFHLISESKELTTGENHDS